MDNGHQIGRPLASGYLPLAVSGHWLHQRLHPARISLGLAATWQLKLQAMGPLTSTRSGLLFSISLITVTEELQLLRPAVWLHVICILHTCSCSSHSGHVKGNMCPWSASPIREGLGRRVPTLVKCLQLLYGQALLLTHAVLTSFLRGVDTAQPNDVCRSVAVEGLGSTG